METGKSVEVLAALPDGHPVAVRQGNLLATSFHPELTGDDRIHRMFVNMAASGPEETRNGAAVAEAPG